MSINRLSRAWPLWTDRHCAEYVLGRALHAIRRGQSPEGYSMRFGLVHVDFDALVRTKKDSYYGYKHVIGNNWFELR